MSLLLDRRYILEHLRLAVLSVEDPVCANVVSLRVPRPTANPNPQAHAHAQPHYNVSKSSSFNTASDANTAATTTNTTTANGNNNTTATVANHTSSSTLALDAATLPLATALPSTVVRQLSAVDFDHEDLATLLHDEHWAVVHDNSPPTALVQAIPNHFQSFLHPHDFDDDEDNSMYSAPSLAAASAPPLPTVPAGVIPSDPSLTASSSSARRSSKSSASAVTDPVVSPTQAANPDKAPVRRSSLAAATSAAFRRRSSSTSAVPTPPSAAATQFGANVPTPSIKLASISGGGNSTSIDLHSSTTTTTSSTTSLSKTKNNDAADPPRNAAPVVLATSMGEELELEADYAFAEDDLNASLMMDSSSLMQASSRENSRRGSASSQKSTRRSSASSTVAPSNPIITLPTISSSSESPKPDDLSSRDTTAVADLPPPPVSPFTAATESVTAAAVAATTPAPAPIPQPPHTAALTSPATAAAVAHQRLQLLPDRTSSTSTHGTSASDTPLSPREPAPSPAPSSALSDHTTSGPAPLFVRKPVPPRHLLSTAGPGGGGAWSSTSATPSALSMLLGAPKAAGAGGAAAAARNPFAATYARFAGKHAKAVTSLRIHIPYARAPPANLIMPVEVARGSTVEQVIGYVLYEYVELGYRPRVDKPRQDVAQWAMRIVEDDGSIDEDFPALDRARPIERFQFDAFALCEVGKWPVPVDEEEDEEKSVAEGGKSELVTRPGSAAQQGGAEGQYQQHQQQMQVQAAVAAAAAAVQASATSAEMSFGSTAAAAPGAASATPTPTPTRSPSTAGNLPPKQFIKVHLYSTIEVRHTTTLNVTSSTPLSDIFHAVCRKRGVNPKDYELRLSDLRTPILDLDKPFSSLAATTAGAAAAAAAAAAGGASVGEMFLMKKSIGASAGDMWLRPPGEEEALASAAAVAAATSAWGRVGLSAVSQFKKFNVVRKMPMFMGKQERVLAVDGEYLHVLPAEGWRGGTQLFDSMKTLPAHFRLQVLRDHHPSSSSSSAGGPLVGGASGIGGGAAAVGGPVTGSGSGGTSGQLGSGGGGGGAVLMGNTGTGSSGLSGSLAAREGKTYDFEAQSKEQAAEICQTIINLVQTVRRRAGVGSGVGKDKGR